MIFNIVLQFFTRFELKIQFAKVPFFQTLVTTQTTNPTLINAKITTQHACNYTNKPQRSQIKCVEVFMLRLNVGNHWEQMKLLKINMVKLVEVVIDKRNGNMMSNSLLKMWYMKRTMMIV